MGNKPVFLILNKDQVLTLYKSCQVRRQQLEDIQRTSDDEHAITDAEKDLVHVVMMLRHLKAMANDAWGESGWSAPDEHL